MDIATVQNLLSGYKSLAADTIQLLRRGLGLRIQMDALGLSRPYTDPRGSGVGPAMAAVTFPVAGFPQLTSGDQVIDVIAALETLQAALGTPITVDGRPNVVPATALSRIAGGVA